MPNWYVERLQFEQGTLKTVSRELLDVSHESYTDAYQACKEHVKGAVDWGYHSVTETCFTDDLESGDLISFRPQTPEGHAISVKSDEYKASAEVLADWVNSFIEGCSCHPMAVHVNNIKGGF